ncbi:MAG: MmcQ/YjbR family DNA-binding protein [Clostridia bacterium]|nr:MmcQ/YjbR family DNA-binding protein [Clostridia bacterium]
MKRSNFDRYIAESYGIEGDHPWGDTSHTVYRHPATKKWFAVAMNIPKRLLGIGGEEHIDAVNLKCDPMIIPDLISEGTVHPAYHMNKTYWVTLPLDGSRDENTVKWLLEISFKLTDKRKKK